MYRFVFFSPSTCVFPFEPGQVVRTLTVDNFEVGDAEGSVDDRNSKEKKDAALCLHLIFSGAMVDLW